MELYHLRTFVTVAEEGHLTRASERLFTSQPAISAHIKALEEELGVSLFVRTPRGMTLSPAGTRLLEQARQTLNSAGEFLQQARSLQGELMGSVRIGLNTDAAFLRLTDFQLQVSERHPQLEVEFLTGSTGINVPQLRIGKLDGAFISGECADPQLDSLLLCQEELAVAVPAAMRERLGDAGVPSLARLPWVYTTPECAHYAVMQKLFESHCCQPMKTVLANQEDALAAMIRAGVGLGIMRREQVEMAENEGLAYALKLELPRVDLRFAYLARRANDPVLKAVRALLSQIWGLASDTRREAG